METNVFRYIDEHFDDFVEETKRYLRQPSISQTDQGIKECAEMTLEYLKNLGAEAKLVQLKNGYPVVYGILRAKKKNAKTLMFYSHYDVTAVKPEQWTFPPFDAKTVEADEIGFPSSLGKVIVARGAHDKKGPVLGLILSLKAMMEINGEVPVNMIFCLEGEEEIGSPHLNQFRDEYVDELKQADGLYGPGSFRQDQNGRLIIHSGYHGLIGFELEARGGDWGGRTDGKDLMSEHIAWVDAPLVRLIRALGTFFDSEYKVTIDGFYDDFRQLTLEERDSLKNIKQTFDEHMWKETLHIEKFTKGRNGRDLVEDFIMKPLLNIDGIEGGYTQGQWHHFHLPMKAVAKLDVRTVPNISEEKIIRKIREHLDKNGFHEISIKVLSKLPWSRSSIAEDICQALIRTAQIHRVEYITWPTSSSANPSGLFNRAPLNLPMVCGMLGHGYNQHRADEYITVEGIRDNIKGCVSFLHEYSKT